MVLRLKQACIRQTGAPERPARLIPGTKARKKDYRFEALTGADPGDQIKEEAQPIRPNKQ
jgi:hypothetical protein